VNGRNSDSGKRLTIGLVMLAGSVGLFWFSSTATLRLVRTSSGAVSGTFERQLFGRIPHSRTVVPHIVSVRVERGRTDHISNRSGTNDSLHFVTKEGQVELVQVQDMFVRDAPVLSGFLADSSRPELSLSSIARKRETRRFAFGQLVGVLMALGGTGLTTTGARGLLRKSAARPA
jgi:hypothetical protein